MPKTKQPKLTETQIRDLYDVLCDARVNEVNRRDDAKRLNMPEAEAFYTHRIAKIDVLTVAVMKVL